MKKKTSSTIKKIRTIEVPSEEAPKLSKKDPEFYTKIGRLSAQSRALTKKQMSAMAKKSHPRKAYHGGRPRKTKVA
jgi:hypothetical protein